MSHPLDAPDVVRMRLARLEDHVESFHVACRAVADQVAADPAMTGREAVELLLAALDAAEAEEWG